MNRIYFLLLLLPLLLFGQMVKGTKSDFWIIEDPSPLVIYNQYEQRLTEQERRVLPRFSAWCIVEKDHLLSDQFTHTVKTILNRKIYYLQISEEGELINNSRAGNIDVIQSARIEGDTVRITSNDQLSLLRGDQRLDLSEGLLVERIFIQRNKTYGREIAGNVEGWIEGNSRANWEVYIPDKSDLALQKQLYDRVTQTVKTYNTRLDKLFTFLNTQYNKSYRSPQWIVEKSPAILKFTLTPAHYLRQFSESQEYLFQEISDLIYGSSYQLSASDGQFIIHKSSD